MIGGLEIVLRVEIKKTSNAAEKIKFYVSEFIIVLIQEPAMKPETFELAFFFAAALMLHPISTCRAANEN